MVGKNAAGIYKQAFVLGEFLLVLLIEDGEEVDLEFGRNLVFKIEEIVGQTPEISPQQLLELVLGHVSDESFAVRAMIGKIHDQKLTVATKGALSAKLVRKDKVITLVNSGTPATITGPMQQGDILIFGTEEFFDIATTEFLGEEGKFDPETIRDRLAANIESADKSILVAGIIFQVNLLSSLPIKEEVETLEKPHEEPLKETVLAAAEEENKVGKPVSPFKSYEIAGQSMFSKVAGVFTDLPHFLRQTSLSFRRDSLDQQKTQSRRRLLFLILAGFISLVCIISFQLRSKVTEGQMKVVSELDARAKDAIGSAEKLIGLNDQIARENLTTARQEILTKAESIFGTTWQEKNDPAQKKIKEILATIDARLSEAMRIYKVEPTVFTDFSLLKANPKIVSATLLAGKILVLDQGNGSVYSVATNTKTAAIVSGSTELKNGRSIDQSTINAYVLSQDIFVIDINSASSPRKVISSDSGWGNIIGVRSFAGNLYLLDTTANQIWKYPGGDGGFASRSGYLQTGLSIDLSKVVDFTIDGSIYALSRSGNVAKFSGGTTIDFKLSALPESLKNPMTIFAGEDTQGIYIYDEGANRVMVFDKTGIYRSQYVFPKLSETIVKVLADEAVKKIFLVSSTKIYATDLK